MIHILLAAFALLVLGWPSVSHAGALSKCVRVVRHASGEMLENGCGGCRLVSVQRARPGVGKSTTQTLSVPEKSRQPLSFLGPGHTRITAERPCPGAAAQPLQTGDSVQRKCVRYLRNRAGSAALINPCKVCRAVKIELVDVAGNRAHRAIAIAPRSPVTFPAQRLAGVRILTDRPCG